MADTPAIATRLEDGSLYATDGLCSHAKAHLAGGLVKGRLIECPKHNGRFDITDGSPQRPPVRVAIKTYQAREHDGKVFIRLAFPMSEPAGQVADQAQDD